MYLKWMVPAAAVAFTVACSHTSSAGRICDQGSLAASGTDHPKSAAKDRARGAWQSQAANIAPAYADWNRARNRSISCSATGGQWPYRTFTCEAVAEPCRDG